MRLAWEVAVMGVRHGASPPESELVKVMERGRRCGGIFEVMSVLAAGVVGYGPELGAPPMLWSGGDARILHHALSLAPVPLEMRRFGDVLIRGLSVDLTLGGYEKLGAARLTEAGTMDAVSALITGGCVSRHFGFLVERYHVSHIRRIPDSVRAWAAGVVACEAEAAVSSLVDQHAVEPYVRAVTEVLIARMKLMAKEGETRREAPSSGGAVPRAHWPEVGEELGLVYAAAHLGRCCC